MAIPTLTLDPAFTGTLLETDDVWLNSETNTLVSLDDFANQTIHLDLGTATTFLTDGRPFDSVILASLTSDSAVLVGEYDEGRLFRFADNAVIGSDDLARMFFFTAEFQTFGTINFDGEFRMSLRTIEMDGSLDPDSPNIQVNFIQSDMTERKAIVDSTTVYGDITTDIYTKLDFGYSRVFGTLEAHNDVRTYAAGIDGQIRLNGEATLNLDAALTTFRGFNEARNDTVLKGDDGDNLVFGTGTVDIFGRVNMGNGWDTVSLNGAVDGNIAMAQGNDSLTLAGSAIAKVTLGKGNDVLDMSGVTKGKVTAYGGSGADVMIGSQVKDTLIGDGGNDTITGGGGADVLIGKKGADTFVFEAGDSGTKARDQIRDFKTAQGDKIDVSAIASTFNATGIFSSTAGEVIASGQYVKIDIDGDGVSDFEINMRSDLGLVESDFILV